MLNKNVGESHQGLETLAFHLIQPGDLERSSPREPKVYIKIF
jgi:hypothetical protein